MVVSSCRSAIKRVSLCLERIRRVSKRVVRKRVVRTASAVRCGDEEWIEVSERGRGWRKAEGWMYRLSSNAVLQRWKQFPRRRWSSTAKGCTRKGRSTKVLPRCYKDVAKVLQGCYGSVTKVLRRCYVGVAKMFRRYYEVVAKMLRRCYEGAAKVLRRCYEGATKVLQRRYEGVTRVLRRCSKYATITNFTNVLHMCYTYVT